MQLGKQEHLQKLQEWHLAYGIVVCMIVKKILRMMKNQITIIQARYFVVLMHHIFMKVSRLDTPNIQHVNLNNT